MEDIFTIDNNLKIIIQQKKDKFKTRDILNILEKYIQKLLEIKMTKKFILDEINEQLDLNINYQTFISFLKKRGHTTTTTKPQPQKKEEVKKERINIMSDIPII